MHVLVFTKIALSCNIIHFFLLSLAFFLHLAISFSFEIHILIYVDLVHS